MYGMPVEFALCIFRLLLSRWSWLTTLHMSQFHNMTLVNSKALAPLEQA
jgi:hypothetical protein